MPFSRPSDDDPSGLPSSRPRSRGAFFALGLIAAITLSASVLLPGAPAEARFAEGGSGEYTGAIDWVDWSPSGAIIPNGKTVTETRTIAGETLATTCSISGMSGDLAGYRSGTFRGDNLDDLYNIGGTGTANSLVSGLTNVHLNSTVSFTFTCGATLNGTAIPIGGLVVADAESSNRSQGEYVQAKPAQADTTWRIIERARNCSTNVLATLSTDKTLRLSPDNEQCSMRVTDGQGPMVIGYMDGATSATVTIRGGGKSAVALGVLLDADFGDAPESYGAAGTLFERSWVGGEVPVGTTNVSDPAFALGTPGQPRVRLGSTIDADNGHQFSADASGDDAMNADDEDALDALAPQAALPGESHTISDIRCAGSGAVAGWFDWNRDGTFGDSERSEPATCAGGTVALTWTVPSDMKGGASFLRLRTAPAMVNISSPLGMTTLGEIEDHAVTIATAEIDALKAANPESGTSVSAGQPVEYTLTFVNSGLAAGEFAWTDDLSGVLDDARMTTAPTSEKLTASLKDRALTVTGTLAAGETATVTYTVEVAPKERRGDNVLRNLLAPSVLTDPACGTESVTCTEHPVADIVPTPAPSPELPPVASEPTPDVPVETTPEVTVPEETTPEETIPEETIPEETIPEGTLPEETIPVVADPEIVIPEETIPEETLPEETIPVVTDPEIVIPEETIPETDVPQVTPPVISIPETDPEVVAPEEGAPNAEIPTEGSPAENAPVTEAPVVEAPSPETPVVDAPESDVPATDAPAAGAPVKDAPAKDATKDVPAKGTPENNAPVATPATDAPAASTPLTGANTADALAVTGGTVSVVATALSAAALGLGAMLILVARRRKTV